MEFEISRQWIKHPMRSMQSQNSSRLWKIIRKRFHKLSLALTHKSFGVWPKAIRRIEARRTDQVKSR